MTTPSAPPVGDTRRQVLPRGRGTSSAQRRWLVVAGIGAAMLVVGASGATQRAQAEETLRHPVGSVVLEGGSTDVQIETGASSGTVEVTRDLGWGLGTSRPQPDESWEGDTLRIGNPTCHGVSWACSIDYLIRVPDGTSVTIHSGSGSIDVAGSPGRVELSAGSGDVDVQLTSAPPLVDVETGSGDVRVQVPEGDTFRVTGDSGSGSREISVPSAPDAAHELHLQTGSGDVDVRQH